MGVFEYFNMCDRGFQPDAEIVVVFVELLFILQEGVTSMVHNYIKRNSNLNPMLTLQSRASSLASSSASSGSSNEPALIHSGSF